MFKFIQNRLGKQKNFRASLISLLALIIVLICGNIWIVGAFASGSATYDFERMWPELNQPQYFTNPVGIAVDSAGNAYVADTYNHRIQKYSSSGVQLAQWGTRGSGNGEFYYPHGIAVDSSGNVYVADTNNNRIQKFTDAGTYVSQWSSNGPGNGQVAYPEGIVIDSSGNVYVADTYNHRIQKFNTSGTYLAQWGSMGTGVGQFRYPQSIAVDASGDIFVADTWNDRIQKFTSSGAYVTQWGTSGSTNTQLLYPSGIDVDAAGNVYVADRSNGRIQKFSSSGAYLTTFGSDGVGNGQFNNPRDIAVNSAGALYIADTHNHRIQKLSSSGEFLDKWGSAGLGNGQMNLPEGIAVDATGAIYVADTNNDRIQKFSSNGDYLMQWGSNGSGNGEFYNPHGITVDSAGNVYVADTNIHRVQKFTSNGAYLTQWGTNGSGNGQFNYPRDIEVDFNGNVYVADTNNHRIQKFSSDGTYLHQWGTNGSGNGQFDFPHGISVDAGGNVYVSDTYNHRVQKFSSSGTYILQWGVFGSGNGNLSEPHGIAVDYLGNVYVAEFSNNRFQKFTSNGAYLTQKGTHGSGNGQFSYPKDIAVDNSGNVFVADTYNNRVQKFVPANKPPLTTIALSPTSADGSKGWFKTKPSITLTASDESSTVTFFKWDGAGSFSPYLGSFDALEGIHTLYYYSTDDAGNIESVKSQIIMVDTVNPIDPTPASTSHTAGQWSNDNSIDISLSGATDGSSGVDGYSYLFTQDVTATPDKIKDAEETVTTVTSHALTNGKWYFIVNTLDNAGNWNNTASVGPFFIDNLSPINPSLSSPSHQENSLTSIDAISISLSSATDDTGNKLTQLITHAAQQHRVVLDGENMVWYDDRNGSYDIYSYNLSTKTEKQITNELIDQYDPSLQGNRIVWRDYRNGNWDIYMHDLMASTEVQITTDPLEQYYPNVYEDKIVWEDWRNINSEIYMYDIAASQEVRITNNPNGQYHPEIYDNRIVWQDLRNGNMDIYMFDLSTNTESRITTNNSDQYYPRIYRDKIVWQDQRNGNWDIYMYNLSTSTETRITSDPFDQNLPDIYGDVIVYDDHRHGDYETYMYDLAASTESRLTSNPHTQHFPSVYENFIAIRDDRLANHDLSVIELVKYASGVNGFSYSFTLGSTDIPDTIMDAEETMISVSSDALSDGSWYFHIRTKDNAGNWTSTAHSGPYIVDNTKPATTLTLVPASADGNNGWYMTTPRIILTASDNSSASPDIFYKWDGALSYSQYQGSFDALEGTHTLFYYSLDFAGNQENVNAPTIKEDTSTPSDPQIESTQVLSAEGSSSDSQVDVTISGASDLFSGLDGFSYSFTTGSYDIADLIKDTEESSTDIRSGLLGTGVWYFHVRAVDNAGNWTATVHSGPIVINNKKTLAITKSGAGSGAVTSSPAGINCGAICTASFDDSTIVTLMASSNTGSTFEGWGGACLGTGTCTVTMDAAKLVAAAFNLVSPPTTTTSTTTSTTLPGSGSVSTPSGSNVNVDPIPTVDITFSSVDSGGSTTVTTGGNGHGEPGGFRLFGQRYTIETTATFSGPITVCFAYDQGTPRNENGVRLFHYDNGRWVDITSSVDTANNIVCGTTSHFSDFMLGDPVPLPNTGKDSWPILLLALLLSGIGIRQLIGFFKTTRDSRA